tara:strand:- start:89 stop:400 length:312 start_codon:yes stop_codon:yes gene_type:complete
MIQSKKPKRSLKKNINQNVKEERNEIEFFNLDVEKIKSDLSKLSYEQALMNLDSLLKELQSDSIPVQDIQNYHIKAKLNLEYCQNLLEKVEQDIVNLDINDLN